MMCNKVDNLYKKTIKSQAIMYVNKMDKKRKSEEEQ